MPVAEFKQWVDALRTKSTGHRRPRGAERIYLPGEIEWERRERALAEGIALPEDVRRQFHGLADDLGLDLHRYLH